METVAAALGLSRAATRARYQRLLARNAVRVVGVVDPATQGLHAMAHLSVFATGSVRTVGQSIATLPTTTLVSIVAGRASLIAEVRAADMEGLDELIRQVRSVDGVGHVETAIYAGRVKDRFSPPPVATHAWIDNVDKAILDILQLDGRVSFARLARIINYSASGTRARVNALLAKGVVRVTAIASPGLVGLTQMCGLGLRLSRIEATQILSTLPAVTYLSLAIGRWDAVATLLVESPADVVTEMDRIRSIPGIDSLEAWTHLEVVKEDYRLEFGARLMQPVSWNDSSPVASPTTRAPS